MGNILDTRYGSAPLPRTIDNEFPHIDNIRLGYQHGFAGKSRVLRRFQFLTHRVDRSLSLPFRQT
jgi:hypothetical protein